MSGPYNDRWQGRKPTNTFRVKSTPEELHGLGDSADALRLAVEAELRRRSEETISWSADIKPGDWGDESSTLDGEWTFAERRPYQPRKPNSPAHRVVPGGCQLRYRGSYLTLTDEERKKSSRRMLEHTIAAFYRLTDKQKDIIDV